MPPKRATLAPGLQPILCSQSLLSLLSLTSLNKLIESIVSNLPVFACYAYKPCLLCLQTLSAMPVLEAKHKPRITIL